VTAVARGSVDHHAAQRAIVRMLYDPGFAARVRARPSESGLPGEVAAMLAGIDPRALRADRLRARRTLGALVEEFKASSVLALDESRSIALLDGFFASPEFHDAVERETPLALAYGRYLARLCDDGRLQRPELPDVIELEAMQAMARREAAAVPARDAGAGLPPLVRLAPGVVLRRLPAGVLDVVRRVEQLLFELGLVAGLGLAADGPRIALPPQDPAAPRLSLLAVPLDGGGLSLVTLDDETAAVLEPLGRSPAALPSAALVDAAAGAGVARARAEALVLELLDDEVLAAAPGGR
jgi:hypothetical protein